MRHGPQVFSPRHGPGHSWQPSMIFIGAIYCSGSHCMTRLDQIDHLRLLSGWKMQNSCFTSKAITLLILLFRVCPHYAAVLIALNYDFATFIGGPRQTCFVV